jgi:hypothetical protein
MNKKRRATDRMNMWTYEIKHEWNQEAFDRLMMDLANIPKKDNTKEVVDNELMAMDLLETVVDDSANKDAINMLSNIGISC